MINCPFIFARVPVPAWISVSSTDDQFGLCVCMSIVNKTSNLDLKVGMFA